jgi:transcriptional regulator with XRE-family HTH domain
MALKKTEFKKLIGLQIKALRAADGLSQRELAEKLGVSSAHLSFWETGRTMPDSRYLEKICKAFEVKLEFVVL